MQIPFRHVFAAVKFLLKTATFCFAILVPGVYTWHASRIVSGNVVFSGTRTEATDTYWYQYCAYFLGIPMTDLPWMFTSWFLPAIWFGGFRPSWVKVLIDLFRILKAILRKCPYQTPPFFQAFYVVLSDLSDPSRLAPKTLEHHNKLQHLFIHFSFAHQS